MAGRRAILVVAWRNIATVTVEKQNWRVGTVMEVFLLITSMC